MKGDHTPVCSYSLDAPADNGQRRGVVGVAAHRDCCDQHGRSPDERNHGESKHGDSKACVQKFRFRVQGWGVGNRE